MLDKKNAIEVKNVTKSFKVYYDKGNQLKERMLFRNRNRYEKRQVLNGISFDVKKGEAIGLIGHNGCGKSTTLKLLTKIIYPDSGQIEMCGRVSSLIELGAGFHPDMSGRENIYTNAAIFGLNKKEIDERIDDIIEFSELEEFIDNPVRTYSSGMYMRLAFSVAINVDADILLIDEILAVGDAGFQSKCFNKLKEIKAAGTTIVIVSHSLGQIEQICDRSIWIHKGEIREQGSPFKVHPMYMDYIAEERKRIAKKTGKKSESEKHEGKLPVTEQKEDESRKDELNLGNYRMKMTRYTMCDEHGIESYIFSTHDSAKIIVEYEKKDKSLNEAEFGFNIFRIDGVDCYGTNTIIDRVENVKIKDKGKVEVVFSDLNLLQGKYYIDIAFHDATGITYHHRYKAIEFELVDMYDAVGVAPLKHTWHFED